MTNTILPIILDIAAVLILLFSALRGRKRGLIKTLSGIIVVVLAFTLAGRIANFTTPYISEKYVAPKIISAITPETETIPDENGASADTLGSLFLKLGIPKNVVTDSIEEISGELSRDLSSMVSNISHSVSHKVTYAILFLIYFVILLLVLSLVFKIINLASKIPGINFVNKAFGLILGILLGYLFIIFTSYILLKFGLFITEDAVSKTYVLKLITSFNPASLITGV